MEENDFARFKKEGIEFSKGNGNFTKATVSIHPYGSFEIYLYGAHVTAFVNEEGKEVLFVSSKALFTAGKGIRGGIPVIFPQFGPGALPQHGFARDRTWNVVDSHINEGKTEAYITMELKDSEATRKLWPHAFTLQLTTSISFNGTLKKSILRQVLRVVNDGEVDFTFTSALHTYFSVSNIHHTKVITDAPSYNYYDKTTNTTNKSTDKSITITSETDKVFYDFPDKILIETKTDTSHNQIVLEKKNFRDAVVWNIWGEKVKGMTDMAAEEWEKYICVEAGAIGTAVTLHPKEHWTGEQLFYRSSL